MSKYKMLSPEVPNVPWQERPANLTDAPIWRYSENPIIGRNPLKGVARIFNSAVMPYEGEFIGVFRGEQTNGIPYIYMGRSKDAIHWNFEENKIQFVDEDGKPFMPVYAYDPRLVKTPTTLSGVRISMAQQLVWQRQLISRHLQELRILFYHLTETQFYSRERLTVTSCCYPDLLTVDIHHLAIFLSVKARIWYTGADTVM